MGNFTPTPRKVVVDVSLGRATRRLGGTCPAKGQITLTDQVEFRTLGWQSGCARLVGVDDALAADNVRPLVVQLRARPTYILVTRESTGRRLSSSRCLECALAPDSRLKEKASAAVLRLDPAVLDAKTLAPADLIVLDHPGRLSEDGLKLLAALLRRGKPILYVTGELIDATNLKRLSDIAGGGLQMPVQFMPPPAGQVRRDLFLTAVRRDEQPFSVFGDSVAAITGRLRFAGGLSSRPLPGGLADDVLATYNDGSACLVLTASDAGVLAVINADLAASNLRKARAFVPLLDELIDRMLHRNHAGAATFAASRWCCNCPARSAPPRGSASSGRSRWTRTTAVPPRTGRKVDTLGFLRSACGELIDEGAGVTWHWPSPEQPGVYRVCRGSDTVFALAVGIPAEESQLESIELEAINRLAGNRTVFYRGAEGQHEQHDDFWKWFGVACVVCMLGEIGSLLAFRT